MFAFLGPNGAGKTTTVEILRATGGALEARSRSSVKIRGMADRRGGPARLAVDALDTEGLPVRLWRRQVLR